MKVIAVAGARPNFMKIAPIIDEFRKLKKGSEVLLVHTGQHYDNEMSRVFFDDLKIRKPGVHLEVGSGTHAEQTAEIMAGLERVFLKYKPGIVLVVGDVNSTLAASLTASKLNIPVAHVEAGLRSFDRGMPEEVNRLVTDSLSDYLFTTSPGAGRNLINEGVDKNKIHFVGNVMIDTLKKFRKPAGKSGILSRLGLKKSKYAVLTLHRPENVDDYDNMKCIINTLEEVCRYVKVVFPVHLRTEKIIRKFKLGKQVRGIKNLIMIPPVGYLDFLCMVLSSALVMTDSGGIQEEATVLNIPCLTLRKNTERPVTVTEGTNTIVGLDKQKIIYELNRILKGKGKKGRVPKYWDGKAAMRIVKILVRDTTPGRKVK